MAGDDQRRKVTNPVSLRLEKEFNGLFLPLQMGTKVVKFLVDTGACWTLMSLQLLESCGLRDFVTVVHEGGLVTIGVLEAQAECESGHILRFVVAVMQRLDTPLLGMNFLLRYGCMLVLDPEAPLMVVRPSRQVQLGLLCGVYKKCNLSGHLVTAILDTGSTHSFISLALASEFKLKRKFCRPMLVTLFDGTITIMFRKVSMVVIDMDGLLFRTDLIIHPNKNVSLLLGMNVLSGSTLCLEQKEILLSSMNPCCVGGEQEPRPSSISLTPPQFSILSASSRLLSSSTTKKGRGFDVLKKWFKHLKRFRWPESGSSGRNETGSGSGMEQESGDGKEAGSESWKDPGSGCEERTESGSGTGTGNECENDQGSESCTVEARGGCEEKTESGSE